MEPETTRPDHTAENDAAVRGPHVLGETTPDERTRQWLGTDPEGSRPANTAATSATTSAAAPLSTPETTSATHTPHAEGGAGSGNRPRVTPPGEGRE